MFGAATTAQAQCQRTRLQAPDGEAGDRMGNHIAIDGNRMVIGAHSEDHSGFTDCGAAYVYVRNGNAWDFEAKLVAAVPKDEAHFGWSVSIDGDYIAVGARTEDEFGSQSGAAYIFRRVGSVWSQQARLIAGDPEEFARFGQAVSIDGDGVLVSAYRENFQRGYGYVFRREGTAWSQEAKLGAAFGGAGGDELGYSVCLDGDVAMLGAWQVEDPNLPANHGVVFVHKKINGVWTYQQKLRPADVSEFENFGISVDVQGNTAVIGKWHDIERGSNAGAAYIFQYIDNEWVQTQKLTAFDGAPNEEFGIDVGLDGDFIVIGARGDDSFGVQAGSAYVFVNNDGIWTLYSKIHASDAAPGDLFGNTADISGTIIGVGAPRRNGEQGSAYVFATENCNPILTVDATCPSGGPITVSWSNATPSNQVALIYAYNLGSYTIPQGRPCAGTRLGIGPSGLQLVQNTTFGSGTNGSRTLFANTSGRACGGYLQLLDLGSCGVSNAARIE